MKAFALIFVLALGLVVTGGGGATPKRSCGGLLAFASNRAQNVYPEIYAYRLDGGTSDVSRNLLSDYAPVPSPDGKRLAFLSDRGRWRISVWIANIDGSDAHSAQSSFGTGANASPYTPFVWSPDSTKLALSDENQRITVVDAATGAATVLDRGFDPVWSPDDSLLAVYELQGDFSALLVERPDGSGRRQLAGMFQGHPMPPVWSPDGTRLLVPGLSVVPLSGGAPVTLSDFFGEAWSLDGTRVLGTKSDQAGSSLGVWSIAADGSDLRQVSAADGSPEGQESFSPDRRFVVLGSYHGNAQLVDLATGSVHDLGPWTVGDQPSLLDPVWSPDSQHVAYWTDRHGLASSGRIAVVDAASGQLRVLAEGAIPEPAWLADSTTLLVTTVDTRGNSDIYLSRPDGTGLRALHRDSVAEGGPAWSSNGKRLAFIRYGVIPSLVLSDLRGRERVLLRLSSLVPLLDLGAPSWSPDGTKIAVATRVGILVVDTRTGKARYFDRDMPNVNFDSNPAWSPDGSELAFARGFVNYETGFIEVDRVNSGRLAWQVPIGSVTFPSGDWEFADVTALAWSPNGTRLALARVTYGAPTDDPGAVANDIHILDTRTHRITRTIADAGGSGLGWSPNGRRLVLGGFNTQITTTSGRPLAILKQLRALDPSWQPRCSSA
jgi:Tol biopolymer transport system component